MSAVVVSALRKSYGAQTIFEDVSFALISGEFVTLLGPSGCGKSTLLRCLAGLAQPDGGHIAIDGQDVTDRPPQKRGIGMVFQSYALFPNMTAAQNVGFGLKMRKLSREAIAEKVAAALDLVELTGQGQHYPHQLSGGQRQRVALARALIVEPAILLLDEPLSALDARIRKTLREQIRDIQRRLGLTTIFVTHDQEEALSLSDRIFVMDQGRIVQEGTAEAVYTEPASRMVARFMGSSNLLAPAEAKALFDIETTAHLAIRPESILLEENTTGTGLAGRIASHQLLGNVIRYSVDCKGVPLLVDRLNRSARDLLADGTGVKIEISPESIREVR